MTGTIRATLAVTLSGLGAVACSNNGAECDCLPTGLSVSVPADSASQVSDVVPSGPACTNAPVSCTKRDASGGCATYAISPLAPGQCQIDVYFSGGTHDSQTVDIIQMGGCCAGLYPSPPSAGAVQFPAPPSSVADAGIGDGGIGDSGLGNDGPGHD